MTSAQPRDLTYGRHELRPPGLLGNPPVLHDHDTSGHDISHLTMPRQGMAHLEPPDSAAQIPRGHSELVLWPGPDSVKVARDFTAAILRGWQLDPLIEEGVIIASELVTNAIRHGTRCTATGAEPTGAEPTSAEPTGAEPTGAEPTSAEPTSIELAWQLHVSRVICVVKDGSIRPPVLVPADMAAESGRGLQVVHALAAAWGWMTLGACEKAVWAALLLP